MISGLQKMTLLDFPGKVACTVFLHGCNYRCPFCHNSELLEGRGEELMTIDAFFKFLASRQGLLEGVCVSGGEPTLYKELPAFLTKIKELGFAVKLDTNGSRPEILKSLVEQGLVDYVAVDAKNSPARYAQTVGTDRFDMAALEESLRFLINGSVDYELRTTLVEPLHTEESIAQMGKWLASLVPGKKPKKLFLQSFVDRDTVVFSGLSAPAEQTVERYAALLADCAETVTIRNK
jgi:pyruvate formate lyase activating enzyme